MAKTKRKDNRYRCSACNELKDHRNVRYLPWESALPLPECDTVGVCAKCAQAIESGRFGRVEGYFLYLQRSAVNNI